MRSFVLFAVVLVSGCGAHSPAAPSTVTPGGGLPFQATRYEFRIVGDPRRCTGDVLRASTLVSLNVNLTPDASGWTARPDDSTKGTLVLTLRPGSLPSSPPRFQLAGTVQGFAIDAGSGLLPVPTGTRVTFGSTTDGVAPISGVTPASILTAVGPVEGTVTFTLDGLTSTCPSGAALWSLAPPTASLTH
jgi:hypothetical protein